MPIRHHVDPIQRRVRIVVSGSFTMDEILDGVDALIDDPAFEPGFGLLSDHTEVAEPITPDQLQAMLVHMEKRAERLVGTHWAIVAGSAASYGMMRMFSVLSQRLPMTVEVFETFEQAERWLEAHAGSAASGRRDEGGEPTA